MSSTNVKLASIKDFITDRQKKNDEQHSALLEIIHAIESELDGRHVQTNLVPLWQVAVRAPLPVTDEFVIFSKNKFISDGPSGCRDLSVIRTNMFEAEPCLRELDLKKLNLVIAGGFVCANLQSTTPMFGNYGDIDLFMIRPEKDDPRYHQTPKERAVTVTAQVAEVITKAYGHIANASLRMFRSTGAVTFTVVLENSHKLTLQIVLKEYSSVELLLEGFDIDPAAVAYDGENVLFTAGAVQAHQTGYMMYKSNFTASSVERFKKYYYRGWGMWFRGTTASRVIEVKAELASDPSYAYKSDPDRQVLSSLVTGNLVAVDGKYFTVNYFVLEPCLSLTTEEVTNPKNTAPDYYTATNLLRYNEWVQTNSVNVPEVISGRKCLYAVTENLQTPIDQLQPDSRDINLKVISRNCSVADMAKYIRLITKSAPLYSLRLFMSEILSLGPSGDRGPLYDLYLKNYAVNHDIPFVVEADPVSPTVENVASDRKLYSRYYVAG
jgi:hypothetical protein